MDDYVHELELKVAARDITIRELEEENRNLIAAAAAHANASAQAQADLVAAVAPLPDGLVVDGDQAAAHLVENRLRAREVAEVRLWGAPWFGVLTRDAISVTLTLRHGAGEVHGTTLGDALDRLEERVGKVER